MASQKPQYVYCYHLHGTNDTLALLEQGLTRSQAGIRLAVCSMLRYYQGVPGVAEVLLPALTDQNAAVRQTAVQALAALGPEASQAAPALIEMLQTEKDASTLLSAVYAVGQMGLAAKPAVPALIHFLNSSDSELKTDSLNALKAITHQDYGANAQQWSAWWDQNKGK